MFHQCFLVSCKSSTSFISKSTFWKRNNHFSIPDVSVTKITLKKKERYLYLTFGDGRDIRLSAEFLRVLSPSADMIDSQGTRKIIGGRKGVSILSLQPVGNYAIRILFDDLHDTGIYSWNYLRELSDNKWKLMKNYIYQLKLFGKSRIPLQNKEKKN